MRTQINPKMYEMELKDFISTLKVLHEAEGVPEEKFVGMLTEEWKANHKTKNKKGSK